MKILVVSDSHGFEGNLRKVIERTSPIDMLIHQGKNVYERWLIVRYIWFQAIMIMLLI